MKTLTVEQAEALPASLTDPAVVFALTRREVMVRYEPGSTWHEPGSEFGSGSLWPDDGPFIRLVPEPDEPPTLEALRAR